MSDEQKRLPAPREENRAALIANATRVARNIVDSMPDVSEEGLAMLRERAANGAKLCDAARALIGAEEQRENIDAARGLEMFDDAERAEIEAALSELPDAERAEIETERAIIIAHKRDEKHKRAFDPRIHQFDEYGIPRVTNRGYIRVKRGAAIKDLFGANAEPEENAEEIDAEREPAPEYCAEMIGVDDAARIVTDAVEATLGSLGKRYGLGKIGDVSERDFISGFFKRAFAQEGEDGKLHAGTMSLFSHGLLAFGLTTARRAPHAARDFKRHEVGRRVREWFAEMKNGAAIDARAPDGAFHREEKTVEGESWVVEKGAQ